MGLDREVGIPADGDSDPALQSSEALRVGMAATQNRALGAGKAGEATGHPSQLTAELAPRPGILMTRTPSSDLGGFSACKRARRTITVFTCILRCQV